MADELMGTGGTSDEKVQAALDAQAASDVQLSASDDAPAEPVLTTKDQAAIALAELYRWHDTDIRFTKKLDAIAAYIADLESAPAVGVAASQPGKKSKK